MRTPNWTAQNLPEELVEILDADAGKIHGEAGQVRQTLAKILNKYDEFLDRNS